MSLRTVIGSTSAGLFLLVAVCPAVSAGGTLAWPDLVQRMKDLERLSTLPEQGETSAMGSSYDRASRYDAGNDRYIDWDANMDGDGCIRREGEDIVLAEMEGPGVVWRIWSAEVRTGNIRIYIDGEPEPVLDVPFAHLFDGGHAAFNYPSLSFQTPITYGEFADRHNLGGGRNLYFPIPYQESIKITAGPNWGRYFQISYTTFPEGTRVPSFTRELPDEAVAALRELDEFFTTRLGEDPAGERAGQETIRRDLSVSAGERETVARLEGERAVTAIRARIPREWDRQTQMDALRTLALQIRWDGQEEPAVWSPLGDFFAIAPALNDYQTLITGVEGNEMYAYWYMPFEREAVIELVNDGQTAREVSFEIAHAPLADGFEGRGHFHAKWHRGMHGAQAGRLNGAREDRWPDWLVLSTEGRGRFVGMHLHVWNPRYGPAPREVAGPGFYWWGEGDEKFHVDGEKFPSTFGTGTEDYFGYAWCDPAYFTYAFIAQPFTEGNAGHQSLVRHQVAENVPFQESFEAYLEKYFPDDYPARYGVTAYWYQAPGGRDIHGVVPVEDRVGYYERPEVLAGGLRVLTGTVGHVETQNMSAFGTGRWTNDSQMWWTAGLPGSKLDIIVPVEEAGRHHVGVVLTRSWNYAIVQFYLNGEKVGRPVDLYSSTVVRTEPISLGVRELEAGDNVLSVEIVGRNRRAQPGYMVGLDEVILRRR